MAGIAINKHFMQLCLPLLPHQTLLPPQLSHPDNVGAQKQDVGQFSLSEKYIIFNFYLFSEWHEVPHEYTFSCKGPTLKLC